MDYIEERIDGSTLYEGVIVNVTLDRAKLIDDRIVKREVVHHPGGVGILPIDDELNCYMVSQYRYPMHRMMLEIPAGKLEKNEDHRLCAIRELSEETGFTADNLYYYGTAALSPGYSTEQLHIYIATGLHSGEKHLDDGEFLNVHKYKLSELKRMVMAGEIIDAKTIIAILVASELYL